MLLVNQFVGFGVGSGLTPGTTGTFAQAETGDRTWGTGSGSGDFLGFSFVPSANSLLDYAKFRFTGTVGAGNFHAELWSNSAGSPGSQIGSNSNTQVGATNTNITFTFAAQPSLTSGTTYWIVLVRDTGSGDCTTSCCPSQAGYGSGRNSTKTSLTDNLGVEWRCEIGYLF
jgi:hypothetical protein